MKYRVLIILLVIVMATLMSFLYFVRTRNNLLSSSSTQRVSRIGAIPLGTTLELPADALLVGLDTLSCDDASEERDVTYILMTTMSIVDLKGLYRRDWFDVEVLWLVDKPDTLSFTVFRKDGKLSRKERFLFSLTAFSGLPSPLIGEALGLTQEQYRQKTFIFLTVKEPQELNGFVYLPVLFKP